jgi:hypothetical protein
MHDDPMRMLLSAIVALILLLGIIHLSGCTRTGSAEAEVQTALDVLADVISPASRIAADTCTTRERAELAEAKAGDITVAEARAAIQVVRERCDVLRETFERMRVAHADARKLVDEGAVDRARARLEEVRGLWRSLATEEAGP